MPKLAYSNNKQLTSKAKWKHTPVLVESGYLAIQVHYSPRPGKWCINDKEKAPIDHACTFHNHVDPLGVLLFNNSRGSTLQIDIPSIQTALPSNGERGQRVFEGKQALPRIFACTKKHRNTEY